MTQKKAVKRLHRTTASLGAKARAKTTAKLAVGGEAGDPLSGGANPLASAIDFGPMPTLIGYHLRRLQVAYKKHFMRVAAELNILPNDVNAIVVIGLNPGLTPANLSMILEFDGAKITAILKMFEMRGLLVRKTSKADGRSRIVYLTSAGKKFLNRLLALTQLADSTFIDGRLTKTETEQLVTLMVKLLGDRRTAR